MNWRKNSIGVLAGAGMLILILDSKCAMESGQQALLLCIRTVIPSLFPFLFFSSLITVVLWNSDSSLLRLLGWFLNLPQGTESIAVSAILGGYPAGAQAIGNAFYTGYLKKEDASKMLCFCSNAGPAFLFGMIAMQFPEKWMCWSLWLIHILSAAMVGSLFPCSAAYHNTISEKTVFVTQNLSNSVRSMALICGWIILFRMIIGFLDKWFLWLFPESVRIAVWGILELSNGCCALQQISNIEIRFIVCAAILSFGGFCVVMQTASVVGDLPIKGYLYGKMLQMIFSLLLAISVIKNIAVPVFTLAIGLVLIPKIYKKRSSIPNYSGV